MFSDLDSNEYKIQSVKVSFNITYFRCDFFNRTCIIVCADMMACQWERREGGREDVEVEKLTNFDSIFLERYTAYDKKEVMGILKSIMKSRVE